MAGKDTTIKPFSKLVDVGLVRDEQVLVVAQPWNAGGAGYRTVNMNMRPLFDKIMSTLHETGLPPDLIGKNSGLIGTGRPDDPLRMSSAWIMEQYAIGALTNVSQVGRLDRATLPIGAGPTTFAFPLNGRSMAAFAAPMEDSSFSTLVPVTNGFTTTYNYGSGELLGNGLVDYKTSNEVYMPVLPEGYDSGDYWVDQIFSSSSKLMVIKLRHYSGDRSKDELAVVLTNGSFDSAYHTAYFLTSNNLYDGVVADGLDVERIESKMKYTAFEQNGQLYLTRFDITKSDTSFGDKTGRSVGLVVYQLMPMGEGSTFRLIPTQVKGFTTTFMGETLTGTDVVTLTSGFIGKPASELDLSIVDSKALEFKAIPMTGTSQAMDRFLDVYQIDDNTVQLRLNRTANFMVTRSTGTRQNFVVNYGYRYNINMSKKTITAVEQDPAKYRPKLTVSGSIYTVAMNKQEATLWNGSTGRMEVRCECNLTITTPTTSSGEAIITQRDTNGNVLTSATIETIDTSAATIKPDQLAIPVANGSVEDGQNMLFIKGTESNGYTVGGLNITAEDQPTYTYKNAQGELMHGYSMELERFQEQRFVNGVNLDSYSVEYNCASGEIFDSLSGYYNTTNRTRFGIIDFDYADLKSVTSKTFVQHEVDMTFGEVGDVETTEFEVYVDPRSISQWINANIGYVDKGRIKIVPFKVNGLDKAFVHLSLVGGIGVGIHSIHLIAECQHNDDDIIMGAVDAKTVNIQTTPFTGAMTPVYEQPALHNVSIFVENETGKVAIMYGNFGEYAYMRPQATQRAFLLNFSGASELRTLPFNSNFGLVTYYLDKVNGISFTSKDSWLQIIHTSEPIPVPGLVPMMARSAPMLLAAPAQSGTTQVSILEPIPFFMSGVNGTIPVQNVVIPSSLVGTKLYLYFTLRAKRPVLEIRNVAAAERSDYTLIALVTTSPSLTVSSEPFIRLSNYRLSRTSKGAAIPVTDPRPDQERFTLWD